MSVELVNHCTAETRKRYMMKCVVNTHYGSSPVTCRYCLISYLLTPLWHAEMTLPPIPYYTEPVGAVAIVYRTLFFFYLGNLSRIKVTAHGSEIKHY